MYKIVFFNAIVPRPHFIKKDLRPLQYWALIPPPVKTPSVETPSGQEHTRIHAPPEASAGSADLPLMIRVTRCRLLAGQVVPIVG